MEKLRYQHKCYLNTGETFEVDVLDHLVTVCSFDQLDEKDTSKVVSYKYNIEKSKENKEVIINVFFLNEDGKYFLAMIDAVFTKFVSVNRIQLINFTNISNRLSEILGSVCMLGNYIHREIFYQQDLLWIKKLSNSNVPIKYINTNVNNHPVRNVIPQGALYQRYIPWLKKLLIFKVFDINKNLEMFHNWMNDEEINDAWQEAGSIEDHEAYIISKLTVESYTIPIISYLDNQPFGYFEVYWSKEDKISNYYQADDFDRGWHVLIGDKSCRGKDYVSAWMPSMSHFLFLDDCRTRTLVIEPRIDSRKMKKNLRINGYTYIKNIDFPHKRAMFHTLNREHFFKSNLLFSNKKT